MVEENNNPDVSKTKEQEVRELVQDFFKPADLKKRLRLDKLNFISFWKQLNEITRNQSFPENAKTPEELFNKLILWQEVNLVLQGIFIKKGFLNRETIERFVNLEIEAVKSKEVDKLSEYLRLDYSTDEVKKQQQSQKILFQLLKMTASQFDPSLLQAIDEYGSNNNIQVEEDNTMANRMTAIKQQIDAASSIESNRLINGMNNDQIVQQNQAMPIENQGSNQINDGILSQIQELIRKDQGHQRFDFKQKQSYFIQQVYIHAEFLNAGANDKYFKEFKQFGNARSNPEPNSQNNNDGQESNLIVNEESKKEESKDNKVSNQNSQEEQIYYFIMFEDQIFIINMKSQNQSNSILFSMIFNAEDLEQLSMMSKEDQNQKRESFDEDYFDFEPDFAVLQFDNFSGFKDFLESQKIKFGLPLASPNIILGKPKFLLRQKQQNESSIFQEFFSKNLHKMRYNENSLVYVESKIDNIIGHNNILTPFDTMMIIKLNKKLINNLISQPNTSSAAKKQELIRSYWFFLDQISLSPWQGDPHKHQRLFALEERLGSDPQRQNDWTLKMYAADWYKLFGKPLNEQLPEEKKLQLEKEKKELKTFNLSEYVLHEFMSKTVQQYKSKFAIQLTHMMEDKKKDTITIGSNCFIKIEEFKNIIFRAKPFQTL